MNLIELNILIGLLGSFSTTIIGNEKISLKNYTDLEEKAEQIGFDTNKTKLKKINDLSENKYIVGEQGKTAYFIYSIELDNVIEYSLKSPSPYLEYDDKMLYAGPGKYLIDEDNVYYSLLENVYYEKSNVNKVSAISNYKYEIDSNKINTNSMVIDSYLIKHPEFFIDDCKENCGYFGGGYCGFIGLGLLVGYQDKYHNDNIMDDKYYHDPLTKTGLKNGDDSISKLLYDSNPKDSTTSKHIKTVLKDYAKSKEVSVDYISRWTPFFSFNDILKQIKNDNPVELFGTFSYENSSNSKTESTGAHALVAYEFDVLNLDSWQIKCHLGWKNYNEVIISGYVIGSIFSFSC